MKTVSARIGMCGMFIWLLLPLSAYGRGWGCTGLEAGFSSSSPLTVTLLSSPPTGLALPDPTFARTFGPFDEREYGFEFIDWLAVQDSRQPEAGSQHKESKHVVRYHVCLRSESARTWWALSAPQGKESLPLDWQAGLNGLATVAGESKPLFLLEFIYNSSLAWTWHESILFDFRSGKPEIVAHLRCGDSEVFGACSATDPSQHDRDEFRCRYSAPDNDFLCVVTTSRPTTWTTRTAESCFWLLTGADVICPRGSGENIASFDSIALQLRERMIRPGDNVLVPEAGPVVVVASLKGRHRSSTYHLLGSPGVGEGFEPRLWLVVDHAHAAPSVLPLAWASLGASGDIDVAPPMTPNEIGNGTPVGSPPSFRVVRSQSHGGFHLIELVVTEGVAKALAWVVVDETGRKPKGQAILLASTTGEYAGCGRLRYGPQLAPETMSLRPFHATLSYKPATHDPQETGEDTESRENATDDDHPRKVQLTWTRNRGFQLAVLERGAASFAASGRVEISEKGRVSFAPPLN